MLMKLSQIQLNFVMYGNENEAKCFRVLLFYPVSYEYILINIISEHIASQLTVIREVSDKKRLQYSNIKQ